MERRSIAGKVEVRENEDGTKTISGLGAPYYDGTERTEYVIRDSKGNVMFRERIMPGAFDGMLSRPDDVRGLWNHNSDIVLGRNKAGTMRISVDAEGPRYEIDVPDTQAGHDAVVSIQRGDVTGSSFGFRVRATEDNPGQRWIYEDDTEIRELVSLEIRDFSPVTYPAYTATEGKLSARDEESALQAYNEHRAENDEKAKEEAEKAKAEADALRLIGDVMEMESQ